MQTNAQDGNNPQGNSTPQGDIIGIEGVIDETRDTYLGVGNGGQTPQDPPTNQDPPANQPPNEGGNNDNPLFNTPLGNEGGEGGEGGEGDEGQDSLLNLFLQGEDTITEEDKATKAQIFTTLKATKVNEKGDLLNDKNEVVLTADQFANYLDNDILPLDDNGNQVTALGDIVKTAEQLALDSSIVLGTRRRLEQEFGIQFPENYELEDTDEGLVQLVQDSIKLANRNSVVDFLNSSPILKQFYQHIALGNKPENFVSGLVDYSNVDVKNLSSEEQVRFIQDAYKKQGVYNADTLIDLIKKGGTDVIASESEKAVTYLKTKQTEELKDRDTKLKEQAVQEQQETIKYWNQVKEVVNKGTLGSINVPVKEREEFFKYMSKPINEEGDSQESLDRDKESVDFSLMVSYLRYKKFDISKLVNNMVQTQRVQTLRDKLKSNKPTLTGSAQTSYNSKGNSDAISIDGLYE